MSLRDHRHLTFSYDKEKHAARFFEVSLSKLDNANSGSSSIAVADTLNFVHVLNSIVFLESGCSLCLYLFWREEIFLPKFLAHSTLSRYYTHIKFRWS